MQITFVSNYINHHQIPVSNELYKLANGSYTFIQTEPMEEERVKLGWDAGAKDLPYVKLYYEDKEACDKLILESDCVIFGGTEKEEIILPRLLKNRFTIRYSERLYKSGRWKFISPRGLIKKYKDHVRFNKNDVYLLCSGAYVKGDFNLIHAYPNKMLKYGYFPEFIEYSDLHELRKDEKTLEILWASRFIDWKHPEVPVRLAQMIKESGLNAHVTMIGNGEYFETTKESASGLESIIDFVGAKTPTEVREYMRKADFFLLTSDHKEGWGAVINEAMNSGCVTIASQETGAAPYLIKSGVNGYMVRACHTGDIFKIISDLSNDRGRRLTIGNNAYSTIQNLWSPKVAAKRLYEFILDKDINRYSEGPLSRA
ncbi:MAG: glycosyltransferase family 4 protein [Lachnospiraceae bacterium]|nr:glycosyltransferase family 4 protein [Lachnospiraceae bacterium]